MIRMFSEHRVRACDSLDGAWRFSIDPTRCGETDGWYRSIPNYDSVIVPSVWNTTLGLLEYEGAAWYQRDFYTKGGTLRFNFGAVMTKADIWLDGEWLGSHYGGFCQFSLIAQSVTEGMHTLTVRADNSFDKQSIPMAFVDWYHYGGIPRSVSVETLTGITVLTNRMEYELDDSLTSAKAAFVLEVYNATDSALTDEIRVRVFDKEITVKATLDARETKEIYTDYFTVTDFELWSPENPKLYGVEILTSTDDLYDRVGLRHVCVKDGKILLNGKEFEVRGANRHEDHPDFGFAFPPAAMRRDIDIALDMGCNSLRGSHYPNSQVFVDMLDECGMTFWSEIPIWGCGFSAEALTDPVVLDRGEMMHREMVKYYYNHPSIIIWGMHNEIYSDAPESIGMASRYYKLLKDIGGNRIVTFATNHAHDDLCLEFCDIVCINQYNGWYVGDIKSWDGFIARYHEYADSLGVGHKPVIISEFGAAAVYGHRTFDTTRWSEEYQAELLGYCIELFHKDPRIVGTYIWQFTDIRTSLETGLTRARGFNNKGVLNEYRNPKAAYFRVKELYTRYAQEEK